MGKGDMRTRKGKIYRGSHGTKRPRKGKAPPARAPASGTRRTARRK